MSNNVKEIADDKNKDFLDDSSVMSKIACHYVSLPKVILKRIDDPLNPLNLGETLTLKSSPAKVTKKQRIKKVSLKSKNIPAKNIVVKNNQKKFNLKTKKALSALLQEGVGKKSSLKQPLTKSRLTKQLGGIKSLTDKLLNKKSPKTTEKKGRGRPSNRSQIKTKSTVKKVVKTKQQVTKTPVKASPKIKRQKIIPEMSAKHEDLMEEDSEKYFDEQTDSIYNEIIHSLDGSPSKVMSDHGIKKQKLSKNVIKLSSPSSAKKTGAVIKGGIIRKNSIPIHSKSKPQMKPNQAVSSLNVNQIKNILSANVQGTQKMVTSPGLGVKQKQLLQTSKTKTPVQQIKQKAITVQSVEAINSKAKKPEPTALTPKIAAKQTATVTPLTKARKSFSTGPPKVHFNQVSKEKEPVGVVESEPVNLLSKLVGIPLSASQLKVVSLSPQSKIVKPSTSPPPLTSIKNENSKTQYVTPTTHEKDVKNKNALDLLKILGDDTEASTSQQVKETTSKNTPSITNGNEIQNSSKSPTVNQNEPLMETDEIESGEEKPRTIYDLIAEINLVYPSWNLHIMPDTNTFCIAQIARGRLGIPVLKKCIELDEAYNAKVYVHQYHCKRFDGQYDSEESIIALIHEINALRA